MLIWIEVRGDQEKVPGLDDCTVQKVRKFTVQYDRATVLGAIMTALWGSDDVLEVKPPRNGLVVVTSKPNQAEPSDDDTEPETDHFESLCDAMLGIIRRAKAAPSLGSLAALAS